MISVVAQSARARRRKHDAVDPELVAQRRDGRDAVPPRVARRGRPEACQGDRHLLDLHRRARAQRVHVHGPRRRLDRRRLRRGALVRSRRPVRPAPRRRARARAADARRRRGGRFDRGLRQGPPRLGRPPDGLRPPRLPGGGSTIAAPPRDGDGSRLAPVRGRRRARARGARRAAPAQARSRARDERRVLVGRRARHRRRAAEARPGDVRLLAHGGLVGARARAEAAGPPRSPVGDLRRPRPPALASS